MHKAKNKFKSRSNLTPWRIFSRLGILELSLKKRDKLLNRATILPDFVPFRIFDDSRIPKWPKFC